MERYHSKNITNNTQKLKPFLDLFNIYGRLTFKQKKDCSYFYRLINQSRTKYDCWAGAKHSLEKKYKNMTKTSYLIIVSVT